MLDVAEHEPPALDALLRVQRGDHIVDDGNVAVDDVVFVVFAFDPDREGGASARRHLGGVHNGDVDRQVRQLVADVGHVLQVAGAHAQQLDTGVVVHVQQLIDRRDAGVHTSRKALGRHVRQLQELGAVLVRPDALDHHLRQVHGLQRGHQPPLAGDDVDQGLDQADRLGEHRLQVGEDLGRQRDPGEVCLEQQVRLGVRIVVHDALRVGRRRRLEAQVLGEPLQDVLLVLTHGQRVELAGRRHDVQDALQPRRPGQRLGEQLDRLVAQVVVCGDHAQVQGRQRPGIVRRDHVGRRQVLHARLDQLAQVVAQVAVRRAPGRVSAQGGPGAQPNHGRTYLRL